MYPVLRPLPSLQAGLLDKGLILTANDLGAISWSEIWFVEIIASGVPASISRDGNK